MPKPFSARHLAANEAFKHGDASDLEIAQRIGCSRQMVSRWHAQYRNGATVTNGGGNGADPHDVKAPLYGTTPEPLALSGIKDRGDGRDVAGRFAEDKLTKAQKLAVMVETLELGTSRTAAYAIAGIPESTAAFWFQKDEEFRAAVLEAESRVETKVANALYLYAISGKVGSHIAAAIFLERNPATGNRWRRRDRLEIEGRVVHVGLDDSMRRIMLSSEAIQAASALEAALQAAEDRQLPAHPDAIDADFREVAVE
jgi:hypothetical protein